VKLFVQPEDGVGPLLAEIGRARDSIETTVFRFDLDPVEKALAAAVTRGVKVRVLVAHTNRGGEKLLRKLELRLLAAGVTLARSDDDLVRYHGKMLIVDRSTLHLMAFNYTRLDLRSRSFAVSIRNRRVVQEALKLFEADMTRQAYVPRLPDLVVSPENARPRLSEFLHKARRQLLIYDPKVADPAMIRLLEERARKGVEIRVIGKMGKRGKDLLVAKPPMRLHARLIVRDGQRAFLGSQSLRKAELDDRREVGIVIRDKAVIKQLTEVFEADWLKSGQEAGTASRRATVPESTVAPVREMV
jgi:phosphatidylserine/phosphatidylglycerophosphate/cardiolipin synthase-like enzyme